MTFAQRRRALWPLATLLAAAAAVATAAATPAAAAPPRSPVRVAAARAAAPQRPAARGELRVAVRASGSARTASSALPRRRSLTVRRAPTPAPAPRPTPAPSTPLLFGVAAAGRADVADAETALGRRVGGVRMYRKWGQPLVSDDARWAAAAGRTLFLSVKPPPAAGGLPSWARVAAAAPGDAVWADILEQARQLRSVPGPVYLAFHHEPEGDTAAGTPEQFRAAWIRYVSALRGAGAGDVRFVWTMTGYGFTRADAFAAERYWPGREYVDAIGADVYNFYRCQHANGTWNTLERQLAGVTGFAARHADLPVVLMEWSSAEDPADPARKAAWLDDAARLLRQPAYRQITAVLQWSGRNNPVCAGSLDYASSPVSLAAMRRFADAVTATG